MVVTRRDRVQCWEEMRFLCKCKRANSGLKYAEWVSMRTQCLVISLGTAVNDGVQYQRLLLTVILAWRSQEYGQWSRTAMDDKWTNRLLTWCSQWHESPAQTARANHSALV